MTNREPGRSQPVLEPDAGGRAVATAFLDGDYKKLRHKQDGQLRHFFNSSRRM